MQGQAHGQAVKDTAGQLSEQAPKEPPAAGSNARGCQQIDAATISCPQPSVESSSLTPARKGP